MFWLSMIFVVGVPLALTGLGLLVLTNADVRVLKKPEVKLPQVRVVQGAVSQELAPSAPQLGVARVEGPVLPGPDALRGLKQQAKWFPIALVFFLCACVVPLDNQKKYIRYGIWVFYVVVCVGLFAVLHKSLGGYEMNGSSRWLRLPSFLIQVSDVAKVALVLLLAHYLSDTQSYLCPGGAFWDTLSPRRLFWMKKRKEGFPWIMPVTEEGRKFWRAFVGPLAILGVVCGLIVVESDLGTTCLCALVGFLLFWIAGVRKRYLLPTVSLAVGSMAYVVYHWRNRLDRVLSFADPEGTRSSEGHQLWQGILSFACGGWDGVGLGNGIQQRKYLPEAHTDFIFAIIGEELGLVVTSLVVLGYFAFLSTVLLSLKRMQNLFHTYVCISASLFIVFQALINMGVATGLLPTKGMSLPFVSYGGSNLVVMYTLVGLIVNCLWRRVRPEAPTLAVCRNS
jgi:cell division protein FtsW